MKYSFVIETDSTTHDQKIINAVKKVFNMNGVKCVSLLNQTSCEIEQAEDNKRVSSLVQQMQLVLNELAKYVKP